MAEGDWSLISPVPKYVAPVGLKEGKEMTDELVDLLHAYMISIGVTISRENAQDILLCAMALLQGKGWKSGEEVEKLREPYLIND